MRVYEMPEKRNKSYEKKLLLSSKATKRWLAEDEQTKSRPRAFGSDSVYQKSNSISDGARQSQVNANDGTGPGKRTSSEYRKHPHFKPTWEKYPHINISKTTDQNENHENKSPLNKKMHDSKKQDEKERESVNSFPRLDGNENEERSLGNASIRNVLASLYKKNAGSLYYRVYPISLPWIIKTIARVCIIWEVILYFTIVMTFTLTSFSAFFSFYEKVLWDWIAIADLIFAADTILRLSVETWRYHTRATVVVFTAPYTMLQILFDVVSMIPLHLIYYWIEGSYELRDLSTIDYFRLNRFLRLTRCEKFFEIIRRERIVNEMLIFIFKFFNYYLGFIYLTSCLFVSCIGVQPLDYLLYNNLEKLEDSFLKDFQRNKPGYGSTPWDIFIITTNFATAVITTVGYGDVVPYSELEMTICIICMLFGAIYLSGCYTSEMTSFRLELDGARFDLYHRLDQIKHYLASMNTLPFFNAKVEEYYNYLWTYREGVFDVPFIRNFPRTFHEELLLDVCLEMFDKSQMFYNLDPAFLRAVSKIMTVSLYNSNMILCRKGKYAGSMYYILQGECQAMSKLNPANASAIIRAGSIIGEASLFFSFPYTTTVETRTCCQFIMLNKANLLEVLNQFPTEMGILRSRSLGKINGLYETHISYGIDPVCWIKAKTDLENPSNPNPAKLRRFMRWGTRMNGEVLDDVVDDSEEVVIFNTPCDDLSVEKNHLVPYISCAVPEILNTTIKWIRVWNYMIMSIACYNAFFGPYCVVFLESTRLEFYMCEIHLYFRYIISLMYFLDVFVEILGACPVAGLYYKFWDGLGVVLWKPGFYLDILAAIPLDLLTPDGQHISNIVGTSLKVLKFWKVTRFIHYLDNVYPLQFFWCRLLQTIISLLYGIHFTACISYLIACPHDDSLGTTECKQKSWLSSYEIRFKIGQDPNEKIPVDIRKNTLGYGSPYLYSFFYATATFTSAGFGDFNPQNRLEMIWAIALQLCGFFLIGYWTSVLTSALSCVVRSKLALQQQLVSLYQFMNYYHLRENLKDRIIEYYVLQHQLRGGVPLDATTHIMYDAPAYLRNDVLYLEVFELLDGIPIFSKIDAELIIKISSSMKLFLIPPNTTFVHVGEVRRILYVIKNGSMGIFEPGVDQPVAVLESSSHFGIRDLLFGEPSHYIIRSLSYVSLYELKQQEFEDVFQYEDDFWELIKNERMRIKAVIHEMTLIYSAMGRKVTESDKATRIPSWSEVPPRIPDTVPKMLNQVETRKIARINLLNDELDEVYDKLKWLRFTKYFLLRKTVHPAGYFSKCWNCLMSLVSCLTVLCLMQETFCYLRWSWFRALQMSLDWINYVDIYLKMHWSYYNPHNQMLVTHPIKTAVNYVLNGSLVMDVVICAPVELLVWIAGQTNFLGYGRAASWYTSLRWVRFFQFKRIPIIFQIVHNIFTHRSILLLTLYVTITIFVCSMVSTIAIFIACPWEANDWKEGDQNRLPMCTGSGWVGFKYDEIDINPQILSNVFRRWILGLYYVSQVILVIGFGDMIKLDSSDVFLLNFMCIFGFLFTICITADMTAAQVDKDQARAEFVEQITVLQLVMKREKIPKKLFSAVTSHLYNTWNRSRGLQPRELFGELHPVLESELHEHLVEKKFLKVPIFHSFPPTVLRGMFRYMKTMYINRGDRIMRFGNLEYEMYIIMSGKVYITDQHLNYICSLSPCDSFGETSMLYGVARRHNAIAACNSEVYVLSSYNFEIFLGRYPDFKNEMKSKLSSDRQDYFEMAMQKKMEAARKLTAEQKHKMLITFSERSNLIKDIVAQKEDFRPSGLDVEETDFKKRNMFLGRGDFDEDLPLLYFAVKSRKKITWSYFVIHPNCPLMKTFKTIVTWMSFITPGIAAYEVCFSMRFLDSGINKDATSFKVSRLLHTISQVIEITFLIKIFLCFFLAFEVKNGVYNKNPRSIIMRYLTSIDGFILDLITTLPFIIEELLHMLSLDYSDFGENVEHLFENLYLLRSIRLYHYFKNILSHKDDLTVSTFRLQITLSVATFCLMAHMLACLFYWISPCTRPDLTDGTKQFANLCPAPTEGLDKSAWTTQYVIDKDIATDKDKIEAWRWWFRSLYWVVTTISTTGFGDIVPVTINEMVVTIVCMFCGSFVLSIILSQFASGMESLTRTKREYMYQVNLLVKHLKNIGLSQTRQSQVMMYFRTLWERCRGVNYHKTWKKLPLTMQIELAYACFGNTLIKVPFFKDTNEKIFIRQLSSRVTHSLYIPGSYVHKDGVSGTSMFVVYKGVVSGAILMANNEPELKSIYNPGDAFGRFAALFHDGVYKKSYRAETMVEILEVQQKDILHLARTFPKFKKLIYNYILTKYQPRGPNVNIFDRQRRRGHIFGVRTEFIFKQAGKEFKENDKAAKLHKKRKHKKANINKKKLVEEYLKQQQDDLNMNHDRQEEEQQNRPEKESNSPDKSTSSEESLLDEETNTGNDQNLGQQQEAPESVQGDEKVDGEWWSDDKKETEELESVNPAEDEHDEKEIEDNEKNFEEGPLDLGQRTRESSEELIEQAYYYQPPDAKEMQEPGGKHKRNKSKDKRGSEERRKRKSKEKRGSDENPKRKSKEKRGSDEKPKKKSKEKRGSDESPKRKSKEKRGSDEKPKKKSKEKRGSDESPKRKSKERRRSDDKPKRKSKEKRGSEEKRKSQEEEDKLKQKDEEVDTSSKKIDNDGKKMVGEENKKRRSSEGKKPKKRSDEGRKRNSKEDNERKGVEGPGWRY